ncbi:hypothetical protein ACE01N_19990 [Saccharicrinis sp. FJH2]|uniref:hypothetical protein n=1 Tax=Saccharicrinis sp. FJH65 TaxID=3344659 RepID=UPI0035F22184
MFDFIRNLISNAWYSLGAVLAVWFILYLILIKLFSLKKATWIRFEYIWISIGFLAVMTIIEDNKKEFIRQELEYVNSWIDRDSESILFLTSGQYHCIQFNHNKMMHTKIEFDSIQSRQDSICIWTKNVYKIIDSTYKDDTIKKVELPPLNINNPENNDTYREVMKTLKSLNENIAKKNINIEKLKTTFWKDFKSGFGVLLLFLAFGLRLTIISYKVIDEKTRHNTQS